MRRLAVMLLTGLTFAGPSLAAAQQVGPPAGRYQLLDVPGHPATPFLIDTTTGCVWHYVQNAEAKSAGFIEVEVQNLHWGLGSQRLIAQQIEGSAELNADQKRALRAELDRTRCGSFSVLFTAGAPAPTPGAPAPPGPTKSPAPPAKAPTKR